MSVTETDSRDGLPGIPGGPAGPGKPTPGFPRIPEKKTSITLCVNRDSTKSTSLELYFEKLPCRLVRLVPAVRWHQVDRATLAVLGNLGPQSLPSGPEIQGHQAGLSVRSSRQVRWVRAALALRGCRSVPEAPEVRPARLLLSYRVSLEDLKNVDLSMVITTNKNSHFHVLSGCEHCFESWHFGWK